MDYDEDYKFGLTQIAWDKRQRKSLTVGFIALTVMAIMALGVIYWFFSRI
jgi:hypothetical protein